MAILNKKNDSPTLGIHLPNNYFKIDVIIAYWGQKFESGEINEI